MGQLGVVEPDTFSDVLDAIEEFQEKTKVSWYRGCPKQAHTLVPSLYRHPVKKQVEEIAALEQSISSLFAQRSLPFLNRQLTDDWDKLFLMQHYGVPTRLLDWTENPFVGLYFAFSGPSEPESDAVLWMCDAEAWNKSALHAFTFTGGVLDQSMDEARYFAPGKPISQMPNAPVMLYGQHNSARIVAQRGVFALFGQSLDGMDTLAADAAFGDGVLTRVVLKKSED